MKLLLAALLALTVVLLRALDMALEERDRLAEDYHRVENERATWAQRVIDEFMVPIREGQTP